MLNRLKRFFGYFDSNRLKHSVQELERIKLAIIFYPTEKQAEYADAVCVKNANNKDFLLQNLWDFNPDAMPHLLSLNATAIGNIAYIALYGSDPEIRVKCSRALKNLRDCMGSV